MNDDIGIELTDLTKEVNPADMTERAYSGAHRLGLRRLVLGTAVVIALLGGGVAGAVTLWPNDSVNQQPTDGGECATEAPTDEPSHSDTADEPTASGSEPTHKESDPESTYDPSETGRPSDEPTVTEPPTDEPTCEPSGEPSSTEEPTHSPSDDEPTSSATEEPTHSPSDDEPTSSATEEPTMTSEPTTNVGTTS